MYFIDSILTKNIFPKALENTRFILFFYFLYTLVSDAIHIRLCR